MGVLGCAFALRAQGFIYSDRTQSTLKISSDRKKRSSDREMFLIISMQGWF